MEPILYINIYYIMTCYNF